MDEVRAGAAALVARNRACVLAARRVLLGLTEAQSLTSATSGSCSAEGSRTGLTQR
jgi:hypothetical protein